MKVDGYGLLCSNIEKKLFSDIVITGMIIMKRSALMSRLFKSTDLSSRDCAVNRHHITRGIELDLS